MEMTVRHVLTPLVFGVLLVACNSGPHTVQLSESKVVFPASVPAGAEIPITVTVTVWGCLNFQNFVAERTLSALKLNVYGLQAGSGAVCTQEGGRNIEKTYTDPGSPPRSDPFEVFVNGKSYGTVAIR